MLGVKLAGAKLGGVTWTTGKVCAAGSIGKAPGCTPADPASCGCM
jgi:hypothetical protein